MTINCLLVLLAVLVKMLIRVLLQLLWKFKANTLTYFHSLFVPGLFCAFVVAFRDLSACFTIMLPANMSVPSACRVMPKRNGLWLKSWAGIAVNAEFQHSGMPC